MADKYISVQAMRKRLGIDPEGDCKKCLYGGGIGACMKPVYVEYICGELDKEPPADVRPVVKGEWEPAGGSVFPMYACSKCRAISLGGNFCPNCGAEMREKAE